MPKGRGRKGGAPPRKKQSTQLTETCTRLAMNVGTQVVSDVGSIGAGGTSWVPKLLPHLPLRWVRDSSRMIPAGTCSYSPIQKTALRSFLHPLFVIRPRETFFIVGDRANRPVSPWCRPHTVRCQVGISLRLQCGHQGVSQG